jgi:peptide/nickel transport system substrate-binding protein
MTRSANGPSVRRRAVLGTLAAGTTVGTGGCLRRARSIAGWNAMEQVSVRIKTLPADADPFALRAARTIAAWYGEAGIDAQVVPVSEEELLRQVLLGNDFDVFLARGPSWSVDPDGLYSLLHSRFADEQGWQNPFGFVDLDVDEHLEAQRRTTGEERREAVAELQRSIARSQPFTPLVFPDDIRAARRGTYTNWRDVDLQTPQGYLALQRATDTEAETEDGESVLRVTTTDRRATENLNPLSVEYRRSGVVTGQLYDSLGRVTSEGTQPWLAASWTFDRTDEGPRATIRLRPDLTWHDGESLTASDVAFTYALLSDTSLGSADEGEETDDDAPVPAPRFQGRTALVSEAEAVDDIGVTIQFVDCSPTVAARALTVPILPEHVWSDRTDPASMAGIEVGRVTEALVTNNIPPVGSGPLQFVRNTPRESLELEVFPDHFLADPEMGALPDGVGPPAYDRFVVRFVGSDDAAIGVVADGDSDVTGTPVGADTVPRIGRDDGLELVIARSDAPYIVGYNTQRAPFTNPRFRNTLARLVDVEHLVSAVFDGYARPTATPIEGGEWVPSDIEWDGTDGSPVAPFIGSDGDVDVGRARETFRDAGFQYDEGRLLRGA